MSGLSPESGPAYPRISGTVYSSAQLPTKAHLLARPGRPSDGLTAQVRIRTQPDESQMARDIAAHLGLSGNRAMRWAIRYAWQHATGTTDHTTCPAHSPCAHATRGLTPGKSSARPAAGDQMTITHSATVEDHP